MADSEDKIVEKFQFKTDIITAFDGSEQRIALRSIPRRYLSYKYTSTASWEAQYLRMLTSNQQNGVMYIPMWHRATRLMETALVGAYYIKILPQHLWGFKGASSCYFYYGDSTGSSGSYYDILAYNIDGSIRLKKYNSAVKKAGNFVFPIMQAVIQPEDSMSAIFSNDTNMTMNFELLVDPTFPSIPSFYDYTKNLIYAEDRPSYVIDDKYNGLEILNIEPTWNDDISLGHTKNADKLDNTTGQFSYYVKSTLVSEHRSMEIVTSKLEETDNIQRFFFRIKGQLVPFYAPTWLNDLDIDKNIFKGDSYLSVKFNQYYLYYAQNKNRKTLIFFMKDFTTRIYDITGYTTYVDAQGVTHGKILMSGLNENIQISNIKMVSYLCRYRLTSDELEVKYLTTEVATTVLAMKEI